ncbi:hypothetical protein [Ekhidna sp.]|uniref:hypothetical protein n=1 Tax=Ekhidna sp. TaxID=2608089 RepID=UPI00329A22D5
MRTKSILIVLLCTSIVTSTAQDIITKMNGDDIQAIVIEVLPTSVKYKKYNNQKGPLYTLKKSEIFMINYENGSKDVFTTQNSDVMEGSSATIYFYRPKKFANGKTKIIVGTVEPDEVLVGLKNGRWYEMDYEHLGDRQFVAGVFSLNKEIYELDVEHNETYYVKCTVLTKGLKVMAELTFVGKATALKEMEGLKEQEDSLVD